MKPMAISRGVWEDAGSNVERHEWGEGMSERGFPPRESRGSLKRFSTRGLLAGDVFIAVMRTKYAKDNTVC